MDSINKARIAMHKDACTNANLAEAFGAGGDALIAETLETVLEAIEAELDDRYMPLPLDSDGVPIHIGDALVYENIDGETEHFICSGYDSELPNGRGRLMLTSDNDVTFYAGCCRHVKLRYSDGLLPCPFCGGEAKVITIKWGDGYSAMVYCMNKMNAHNLGNTWDKNEKKAIERIIEAWNTRAERTCKNVGCYFDSTRFECSVCGYKGWTKYVKDGSKDKVPNYCPECGARVVS